MIIILLGKGREVERVYRLSKRECREEVSQCKGKPYWSVRFPWWLSEDDES